MSRKNLYKIQVKGLEWTIIVQTHSSYIKSHGSDSEAITYTSDREVFFNKSYFRPSVVRHELMHCYVASCNTTSSNLKKDQIEELCAEIFAEHGQEMMDQVDRIVEHFMRKVDSK